MMIGLLQAILLALIVPSIAGGDEDALGDNGPHLAVSAVHGKLKIDRPGMLLIEIKNEAEYRDLPSDQWIPEWLEGARGTNVSDALGISAELWSDDGMIKMLSGPQLAGSLPSGESRLIEFSAAADPLAEPGVSPANLVLNYSRVEGIQVTGEQSQPMVAIQYSNVSQTIPVDVGVAVGAKISVDDVSGAGILGEQSDLQLAFINSGDEPASKIEIRILPQRPFRPSQDVVHLGTLGPGGKAWASFVLDTENGTAPGDHALPIEVSYLDGKGLIKEELAAIVAVNGPSGAGWLPVAAIAVLLIVAAIFIGAKFSRRQDRGRRWKRR